jgi:hypothetical protein
VVNRKFPSWIKINQLSMVTLAADFFQAGASFMKVRMSGLSPRKNSISYHAELILCEFKQGNFKMAFAMDMEFRHQLMAPASGANSKLARLLAAKTLEIMNIVPVCLT